MGLSQLIASSPIKVVSLFAGCGGLDLGLEATGRFETVFAIDNQEECIATLEMNRGIRFEGTSNFLGNAKLLCGDVESWLANAEVPTEPWVLVGGPPCQPFSAMGKKANRDDRRSDGVFIFLESVRKFQPDGFLMENVPRLATNLNGSVFHEVLTELGKVDYQISSFILNAADYGSFTKRQRLFILGVKHATRPPQPPKQTNREGGARDLPPWRGSREALSDLEDLPSGVLSHHSVPKHTPLVAERFASLKHGQYDYVRKRAKLDPEQPCPSMMAGASGGFVHHIHYISRELTSRECARLQGFPDDFNFSGSPLLVAKQIVNAVPIKLGFAVGNALADAMVGQYYDSPHFEQMSLAFNDSKPHQSPIRPNW